MGSVKSKGARLNWPLLDDSKSIKLSVDSREIVGNVRTSSDLKSSPSVKSSGHFYLVP